MKIRLIIPIFSGFVVYLAIYFFSGFFVPDHYSDERLFVGSGGWQQSVFATLLWLVPGMCAGWMERENPLLAGFLLGLFVSLWWFLLSGFLVRSQIHNMLEWSALFENVVISVPTLVAAAALGYLVRKELEGTRKTTK